MRLLTREQVREVDRLAIEELGIPGVVLMENAGRAVSDVVLELLGGKGNVVVLCGGGNNGGDGYVVARHLYNAGVGVTVLAAKPLESLEGDAGIHARVCGAMGLSIVDASSEEGLAGAVDREAGVDVVVDALLGTGFCGVVRGPYGGLIRWCNSLVGAKVVSVDVPSGLDCDTGLAGGATVRADVTVTFIAGKVGFEAAGAGGYVGRVVVAGIGTPPELVERVLGGGLTGQR